MMEKLDESYKLKVDLMRHELRVAEEQRELSLNNSKRRGKKVEFKFLFFLEKCRKSKDTFVHTVNTHNIRFIGLCRLQRQGVLYDVRLELLWDLVNA